jgi:hypothetical protein
LRRVRITVGSMAAPVDVAPTRRMWRRRPDPRANLAGVGVIGGGSAIDGCGGRLVAILLGRVDQAIVPTWRNLPASFYPGVGIFFEDPDCPFAGLNCGRPFAALNQPVDVPLGFSNFLGEQLF